MIRSGPIGLGALLDPRSSQNLMVSGYPAANWLTGFQAGASKSLRVAEKVTIPHHDIFFGVTEGLITGLIQVITGVVFVCRIPPGTDNDVDLSVRTVGQRGSPAINMGDHMKGGDILL